MMHIDQTQAQALAAFVGRIRPDWDHPGIVAAIGKARHLGTAAAVGAALCRLAENLEIRTPAILEQPGKHWAGTTVATRQAPVMCPEHPAEKAAACPECLKAAEVTDHSAGLAAVRAAIATAPPPPRTDRPDQEKKR